jgi:quercetin dioxygenase-like cupin family protein
MSRLSLLFSILLLGLSGHVQAIDPAPLVRATPLLKTATTWDGQPIAYPAGPAEVTALHIVIEPGGETGWHLHPVPSYAWVIEGELEVRLKDGRTRLLRQGDALAEVVNTWHNGRNVGAGPVKLVVFYAGVAGQPLSRREP